MICPKCKHDIPVSSDYCPECGARQIQKDTRQRVKAVPVVVCIVVLLIIISTLSGEIVKRTNDGGTNSAKQNVAQSAAPNKEYDTVEDTGKQTVGNKPTQQSASPFDDDTIDVDIGDCRITYEGHEIVKNMADEWCVAVYYTFTNNSTENKAFDYTVQDKAFQNGIELETSLFHVNDYSRVSGSELQPGVSATVCSGFVLQDTSNVELQIYPWISFSGDPEDAMILSLESDG